VHCIPLQSAHVCTAQALFGIVDQRLFGPQSSPPLSSTDHVSAVHKAVGPAVPYEGGVGSHWHCRFGHFTGESQAYSSVYKHCNIKLTVLL
jgi:hypothetical protein